MEAEAFALALLMDLKQSIPFFPRFTERIVLFQNRTVQDFVATTVHNSPYIRHAMKIGLGELPGKNIYKDVPDTMTEKLGRCLE